MRPLLLHPSTVLQGEDLIDCLFALFLEGDSNVMTEMKLCV